jgi:hypothetical protein
VDVPQPLRGLAHHLARLCHSQPPAPPHQPLEIDPLQALHHQVVRPTRLAGVGGDHHVRVLGPAGRLHLLPEAGAGLLVVRQPGGQHLQREHLPQVLVPRPVDRAHAALAQAPQQAVGADPARPRRLNHRRPLVQHRPFRLVPTIHPSPSLAKA